MNRHSAGGSVTTPLMKRLIAARTAMLLDDPFFGALALRLSMQESDTVPTAATDGTRIIWSPKFAATLSQDQLKAVMAHEVMHCAAGHPWRRDGREPKKWNIACDLAINGILADTGYKIPPSGLMPNAEQAGKSAEWIFARLPDPPPGGSDPGGMGEVSDSPTGAGTDSSTQADWEQAVQQAAVQAKRFGKLPASLARLAAEAVAPKIDWRVELRAFLEHAATDYSWSQPATRYLHMGLYLPRIDSHEMPPLAIVVDTSGSMDAVALAVAKAELEAIVADTMPQTVHVLYADASVAQIDSFERGEPVDWRPAGGGGTDFAPALAAIDALHPAPVTTVYITDLCGSFPATEPAVPVIWVTTSSDTAPFGSTLRIIS